MKKNFTAICFSFLFVGVAQASGDAGGHMDKMFWYSVFNFSVLAFILYFFLKKPAKDFFRSRSTLIAVDVQNTKKMYDDAYRKYEEIEAKLKNADVEGKKLLQSLKEEAESEKKHMLQVANEFSEKMEKDTQRIIGNEVKRAVSRLKKETVNLATQLAASELESQLDAEKQKQIGKDFIVELENREIQ